MGPTNQTPTSGGPAGETFGEVLAGARSGAPWAYRFLWQRYSPAINGFLRGRKVEDPEDLANHVFLRAFRAVEGFDGDESAFRSWLFSIARNMAIDDHRSRQRRPQTTELTVVEDDPAPDRHAVEETILARNGMEWVDEVCSSLTQSQRDVVLLRVVADLSLEEVAEIVGKRPNAVKALQRRALRSLQRKISGMAVSQ